MRAPVHERANSQQVRHGIQGHEKRWRGALAAVVEIASHAQVRKKPGILEHHADAASLRRHIDAGFCVEQQPIIDRDLA